MLADDHALVRAGLAAVLNEHEGFEVVATVADSREAVRQAVRTKPDIALMDMAMPELNGIEATEQIREACPSIRILIVSMYSSIEYVYRALRAGANGYLVKTSAPEELIEAIKAVMAGRRYLSRGIAESVLDDYMRARSIKNPLDLLSARERQILQLVAEGRSSAYIARALSLSPKTIDTYRSRMMHKLGITEFPALIKFDIQHGLTPPEQPLCRQRIGTGALCLSGMYRRMPRLDRQAAALSERTAPPIRVSSPDINARLPVAVEMALFRIAQEAINNSIKHAEAGRIDLTLRLVGGHISLVIADDGVGFDPDQIPPAHSRWGMTTMRERAEAVGATLRVESVPGKGTGVIVDVPAS